MHIATKNTSDSTIVSLIEENSPEGWEYLYEKYAPVMYGIICNYTDNKLLAEEIFSKLFIQLKEKEIIGKINSVLCVCILRYTYTSTRQELTKRGMNYTESGNGGNSLIHIFCSQNITVREVATNFKISKEQVRRNLHTEFLALQSHTQKCFTSPPEESYKKQLVSYTYRKRSFNY